MTTQSRALVATFMILTAGALARAARTTDRTPAVNLDAVPLSIGHWTGRDAGALDEESERILAADAYINRSYRTPDPSAPVGLYIAYYGQQRPGVSIHSPLHCLPGTGWEPLDVATIPVTGTGAAAPAIRRMIVSKNIDRAVVLYWYAVHGRILAGEVESKLWLVHDSLRLQRSDAALVRVVVPAGREPSSLENAQDQGVAFVRDLLPYLQRVWS
ncbi:MAG TPA: EpsI family protein [Vicinamibacterales bacterium]|nr:EpsI family protein [Vicinamibacterales bacterium]